jgi:hypothetical protein
MLAAAYMSLNGVDALCWSTVSSPDWLYNPVGDQGAVDKRSASVPQIVGMFPANAVAFRRGYIARADKPVLHEARSLEALRNRKVPVLSDGAEADDTRPADAYGADARIRRDVDRLALLAGPAKVAFGTDAGPTSLADLDSLIDRDAGTVTSSTGQIRLDWNKGICTVQAPKYQAIAGFLRDSGGVVKLSHLGIDSINDYLSVAAVSLDDKPLAQSGKVLIQVGAVARPSKWATLASNVLIEGRTTEVKTIVNAGENPWKVIETKTSLTLKNGNITRATVLDHTGRAAGEVAVRPATDGIKIALPPGAMYVLLQ